MDRINKKNILILCDAFPPAFNPRMGYLCKYLAEWGWNPVIITEYLPQDIYKNLVQDHDVTYINYYWSKNKTVQRFRYVFTFFADLFFNYKNRVLKKAADRKLQEYNISLILSSSHRVFPAMAAYLLSKKQNIPFIMDLRDIFEQSSHNELISKKLTNIAWINKRIAIFITRKLMRQRNKMLRKANAITTVSGWHVKTLSQYNKQVFLIYNGYDPELFFPEIIKNNQFFITYTGRLHSKEVRNPELLFEAIAQLANQHLITPESLRIKFYCDKASRSIIRPFAEHYGVNAFIDYHEMINHSEIPYLLNSSSILLLLANKATVNNEIQGIMTTKLFEYLAVEKPILCVRNDNGCIEATLNKTQSGTAASTATQAANFIMVKYREWQKNGFTTQLVNKKAVQQFSRRIQAEEFVRIFDNQK